MAPTNATKSIESANRKVIDDLKQLGFSDAHVETPRRIVASIAGKTGTGKSHFSLTGEEPIIYYNIDIGTEGVVNKFQDEGKLIFLYDVRVPKESTKDVWSRMWADIKVRIRKTYEMKTGTVIFDTASELYELARLAHFGRLTEVKPSDYAVVNNDWREVLRTAYDAPISTVFIHKVKNVWRMMTSSSGRSSLTKTEELELSGFSEMEYMVQVALTADCIYEDGTPIFSVSLTKCRPIPELTGTRLEGEMCNMETLLNLIHGVRK